jgi:hypothetical protein
VGLPSPLPAAVVVAAAHIHSPWQETVDIRGPFKFKCKTANFKVFCFNVNLILIFYGIRQKIFKKLDNSKSLEIYFKVYK